MLSFLYRLLTRARKLDDVTLDMIGTFEEARVEAQSHGRWNYFVFGVREISGLLGSTGRISKAWWTLIPGAGLAGLAIGAAAFYVWPASYTAETVILVVPPSIPQNLIASGDTSEFDRGLANVKRQVLSRTRLLSLVGRLYPQLSQGNQDAALVEMIKAIRIEPSGDSIRVAFTYKEKDYPPSADYLMKAAAVANDLTSLFMDETLKRQIQLVSGTVEFFKYRANDAGVAWEKLNAEIRGLSNTNPHFDRLVLDREMARKEYESLRQKMSEAEGVQELAIRQKAAKLMVLEPARVPDGPDVSRLEMELYGLGGGLLTGFFAWLLLSMRNIPRLLLTPEAAPSD